MNDQLFQLQPSGDKGYGLFATQDIKRGTRIIAEEPIIHCPQDENDKTFLFYQLPELTDDQRQQYADLYYDMDAGQPVDKEVWRSELAKITDKTGEELDNVVEHFSRMYAIFATNRLEMGNEGKLGHGVFLNLARMNHSCRPNVFHSYNDTIGKETVHAIRDIAAGEELLTTYVECILPTQERQQTLQQTWDFTCDCEACNDQQSEKRRVRMTEIHGTLASIRGHDSSDGFGLHGGPKNKRDALQWAEEMVVLMKAEGLWDLDLCVAYRDCAVYSKGIGHYEKALAYAKKEREIEHMCIGDETDHLDENLEGSKFWLNHLENLSEQEMAKVRMDEKRFAKEDKKAEKKAAKKAGKALK